jgi:hypothetical protein
MAHICLQSMRFVLQWTQQWLPCSGPPAQLSIVIVLLYASSLHVATRISGVIVKTAQYYAAWLK